MILMPNKNYNITLTDGKVYHGKFLIPDTIVTEFADPTTSVTVDIQSSTIVIPINNIKKVVDMDQVVENSVLDKIDNFLSNDEEAASLSLEDLFGQAGSKMQAFASGVGNAIQATKQRYQDAQEAKRHQEVTEATSRPKVDANLFAKMTKPGIETMSPLLDDFYAEKSNGNQYTPYVIYGKVLNVVKSVPTDTMMREPSRKNFQYYDVVIGGFAKGSLQGEGRVIPASGHILVASSLDLKFGQIRAFIGYLSQLSKNDLYGLILSKIEPNGLLKSAFIEPVDYIKMSSQNQQEVRKHIENPEAYCLTTIVPTVFSKNEYIANGSFEGFHLHFTNTSKETMSMVLPNSWQEMLSDYNQFYLRFMLKDRISAITLHKVPNAEQRIFDLLAMLGHIESNVTKDGGILVKANTNREIEVFINGISAKPFAELYKIAMSSATKKHSYIFINYPVGSMSIPHCYITKIR